MDEEDQSSVGDSTGREEVELLRKLVEIAEGEEERLHRMLEKLDQLIAVDTGIAATLTTFLAEWEAANTAPSDPAVKVVLTWRAPQPKGP